MLPWSRGSVRQIPCATGTELEGLEGFKLFEVQLISSEVPDDHPDTMGFCWSWWVSPLLWLNFTLPFRKTFFGFVLVLLCNIVCWKHGICFLITQGLIVKRLPMNQKQSCTFELWGLLKLGMCFVLWSIYKTVDIRCGNLWFKRICVLSRQEVDLWWLKFCCHLGIT